jgi:hypothetical protein
MPFSYNLKAMSRAGRTMFWFGFWVLACGIFLMFFPGMMLRVARVTVSNDVILRIQGMVLIFLAIYYFVAGRHPEFRPLYQVTVYTRASALPVTAVMVLLLRANPLIILFTVVDALGALWTALALRADSRDRPDPRTDHKA